MDGAISAVYVYLYNDIMDPRLNGRGVPKAMSGDGKGSPLDMELYKEYAKNARLGFINGLKRLNAIAAVGGIVAAYEGDTLWSVMYDTVAISTDLILVKMDAQSFSSTLIDYGVDMISPDGADGKVAGTLLKQYIKGL